MDPEDLTTAEVLAVARERLLSLPEAARWLDAQDPDRKWYDVKVHRAVQEGRLDAVKIGGDKSEGYNFLDLYQVRALLEELAEGQGEESEDS